jgi:hypothetical protein
MAKPPEEIEKTKRLMGALLRMPPKPHSEMKVHKKTAKKATARKANRRPPAK